MERPAARTQGEAKGGSGGTARPDKPEVRRPANGVGKAQPRTKEEETVTKNEAKKSSDPIVNWPNDYHILEFIRDGIVPAAKSILVLRDQSAAIEEAESPILEGLSEASSQALDDLPDGGEASDYEVLMVAATAIAISALGIDNKGVVEDALALQEVADIGLGVQEMPEYLSPLYKIRKEAIHELRRMEKTSYQTTDAYIDHVKKGLEEHGVGMYDPSDVLSAIDTLLAEMRGKQFNGDKEQESANA